jgi:hypothetical protein
MKAMGNAIPRACLVTLSVVLLLLLVFVKGGFQFDFNGDLYLAGSRILHGLSPYQPQALAAQAAIVKAGGTFVTTASPRYPAPVLVALTPLSLLPLRLADVLFFLVCVAAVVAALRLLDVRDWRCYVLAGLSWPVVFGVWLGNVSPLLLLGTAVAWRWRSRLWPAAAAIAALIVAKLFLWPLGLWLVVTRRVRVAAVAALLVLAVTVGAWAVIGFADFTEYPRMLTSVAAIGEGRGSSLVATLMSIGVTSGPARVVALLCGIALFVPAWRLARLPGGDRHAFGLFVMASLIASPVVWTHYLVLVFIPIALLSPGLSGLWFLPMLAGLAPTRVTHPYLWVSLPALALEMIVIVRLCAPLLNRSATDVDLSVPPAAREIVATLP